MPFFDNLRKNATAVRNAFVQPSTSPGDESLLEFLGIPTSGKRPQNDVTYYICLKKKAETLGSMPLKFYQKSEGKIETAKKDDMAVLLTERPNPYMTPATFWSSVSANLDHYGNAYVWVQQDFTRQKYGGSVKAKGLWIMPSNQVNLLVDDAGIFGTDGGGLYYWYQDRYTGHSYIFDPDTVLHFKNFFTFDGYRGASVLELLRSTVDGQIAAQEYQNKLFKNGMTGKAVLNYTGELSEGAKRKMIAQFEEFGAGASNAGRIIPVPPGFKLEPIDFKLSDAQFLELKQYGALQLAAAFGIKPTQINDYSKSSYANSEQQQLAFLTETMLFPISQIEQELNYKCLTDPQRAAGFYYKFNDKVLLRTDSKTQTEIFAQKVDKGIATINECRELEDNPPVQGGDNPIVNGTYIPLDRVGDQYGANNTD